jgi:hypothetical protein
MTGHAVVGTASFALIRFPLVRHCGASSSRSGDLARPRQQGHLRRLSSYTASPS